MGRPGTGGELPGDVFDRLRLSVHRCLRSGSVHVGNSCPNQGGGRGGERGCARGADVADEGEPARAQLCAGFELCHPVAPRGPALSPADSRAECRRQCHSLSDRFFNPLHSRGDRVWGGNGKAGPEPHQPGRRPRGPGISGHFAAGRRDRVRRDAGVDAGHRQKRPRNGTVGQKLGARHTDCGEPGGGPSSGRGERRCFRSDSRGERRQSGGGASGRRIT